MLTLPNVFFSSHLTFWWHLSVGRGFPVALLMAAPLVFLLLRSPTEPAAPSQSSLPTPLLLAILKHGTSPSIALALSQPSLSSGGLQHAPSSHTSFSVEVLPLTSRAIGPAAPLPAPTASAGGPTGPFNSACLKLCSFSLSSQQTHSLTISPHLGVWHHQLPRPPQLKLWIHDEPLTPPLPISPSPSAVLPPQ